MPKDFFVLLPNISVAVELCDANLRSTLSRQYSLAASATVNNVVNRPQFFCSALLQY